MQPASQTARLASSSPNSQYIGKPEGVGWEKGQGEEGALGEGSWGLSLLHLLPKQRPTERLSLL